MVVDKTLLDKVSEQAMDSPRLRMNYNFHQSLDEKCHRFLNAVEPWRDRLIIGVSVSRGLSRIYSRRIYMERGV
jgi:hypothetical protein